MTIYHIHVCIISIIYIYGIIPGLNLYKSMIPLHDMNIYKHHVDMYNNKINQICIYIYMIYT